jgi:hypothetical protein
MKINGICGLPCQKLVRNFKEEILIEPLPVFKVVKDLIVDLDPFFEKYHSIKPYLITKTPPPDQERVLLPSSGLFDIFSIQGMRLQTKESPFWIIKMGHGVARPCGNIQKSVPRRFLSPNRSAKLRNASMTPNINFYVAGVFF